MPAPLAEPLHAAPLKRDHPVPLHARLRDDLGARIAVGAWRPGSALPSEAQLSRRYGVSRITVRQALQGLAQQGLIVKVAGKGSFVAGPRPYQHLAHLQGLAEAVAAQGHSIRNRVLELSRVGADAVVAASLGVPEGTPVTHIRRVRLLDGRPLSLDLTWLPLALGDRLAAHDLESRDIFGLIENELAVPLGHADLSLTAVAATPAVAEALGVAAGSALLHVQRLTHDRHGRPLDHEQIYCRSDCFELRLRIDRQPGVVQ